MIVLEDRKPHRNVAVPVWQHVRNLFLVARGCLGRMRQIESGEVSFSLERRTKSETMQRWSGDGNLAESKANGRALVLPSTWITEIGFRPKAKQETQGGSS